MSSPSDEPSCFSTADQPSACLACWNEDDGRMSLPPELGPRNAFLTLRPCWEHRSRPSDQKLRIAPLPSWLETVWLVEHPGVVDVAPLAAVPNVLIHDTRVENVASLAGARSLVLDACQDITDISAFGAVDTLALHYMHGVTDVSPLASVRRLTIGCCKRVADVSALVGRVADLNVYGCPAAGSE